MRGTSSDSNLVGDHPWLGGTTYGAVDSLAGPSMAAIDSPAGPSMAAKFAVDGPAGPVVGRTIGGMTGHPPVRGHTACTKRTMPQQKMRTTINNVHMVL